jgi:hypothetical protein
MMKIAFLLTLVVAVLVCLLPAAPAQALVSRTFVSAAGSDSNNCANVLTPCRHLAAAYAATAANGEIYVLDPANYGSLTITGPVSIEGHGWASIAPVADNPAITINANAGDKINIIGVVLDGAALSGTTGIQFNSGGTLTVRDSVIRNFGFYGINFVPTTLTSTQILVSNTLVSDNGSTGITIAPANGAGNTTAVVNHVEMENNPDGLVVETTLQTVVVTVSDSAISNSSVTGLLAISDGSTLNVMARNCTIASNATGLSASGTNALIRITRSTITGNTVGWVAGSAGVVSSYADNNIDGNFNSGNTEPPGPLTYK